jgi:hypothetical protein
MRSPAILMLLLAGCGSSPSPKPTTPTKETATPQPTQPVAAKPDDPKLAFAKQVFVEVAAGNVEALVKMADPLGILEKTAECKFAQPRGLSVDPKQAPVHNARESITFRVNKTRGLKIDVLALAPTMGEPYTIKSGTQFGDCVAKRDLVQQPISIKIRAQRDAKPAVEQTVTFKGIELDGRWYLYELPSVIREKDSSKAAQEAVAKMGQFADAMCKCKDRACADKVQEELMRWATEMARTADGKDEAPDPDLAKQASEIMTRYTECMTKIMIATQPAD